LSDYDYSQFGYYFVTICTRDRESCFAEYPKLKNIVLEQWQALPNKFSNIDLDEYVIMPNHLHGIVVINDVSVGATLAVAQNTAAGRAGASPTPIMNRLTLGDIIGTFKSISVNKWLKHIRQNNIDALGIFWQRNYYEHIIRDQKSLNRIRQYIISNPNNWETDENNPKNFK